MTGSSTIFIIGPSGCGKSTIGEKVAEKLGFKFADGDDFHTQENREKMKNGTPLTDEDRRPWLEKIRDFSQTNPHHVIACSALKKSYRNLLSCDSKSTVFFYLKIDRF
ncbi:hypothetical protein WR25_23634 [Diploscapter pachys]|uniref:Gluconokinase n=1 Tax=Diploscapter pachys TaxID=2018661 RepID=A0A2A2J7A1_9BILA|nr:hypothetical protein WR25_23634 [Diploscapter pachys]